MLRAQLASELRAVMPPARVLADEEVLRPFETDAFINHRALPLVAVLPENEAELASILNVCRERAVPIVARGAGTSISGGSIPHEEGVLLVLSKLRAVLSLDALARSARVQPGVRNLGISEAASPHGLFYAPDPSSQQICSIGGNIGENSGGVHCLKYGLTVHNVLALRALTIDGDVLRIGGEALDAPGYDVLALLIGSEGMLAVTTEATVMLRPLPEFAQAVLAAFDTVPQAGEAVGEIIGGGIIPAGLEVMDKPVIEAVEEFMHPGYPAGAQALLLCELDGTREEVAEEIGKVEAIMRRAGASQVRVSRDEAERELLWKGRKNAYPALAAKRPDIYTIDGSIPRKRLGEMLERILALGREHDLLIGNVFHAGDGNLHPCIFYDANVPGQAELAEAVGGRILEMCIEMGGTITGEHGVGVEKLRQMCQQFREAELATFHAIKRAFDPHGLLNPGKAVPTLKRCSEWGGLHIVGGKIPRAEIPRF